MCKLESRKVHTVKSSLLSTQFFYLLDGQTAIIFPSSLSLTFLGLSTLFVLGGKHQYGPWNCTLSPHCHTTTGAATRNAEWGVATTTRVGFDGHGIRQLGVTPTWGAGWLRTHTLSCNLNATWAGRGPLWQDSRSEECALKLAMQSIITQVLSLWIHLFILPKKEASCPKHQWAIYWIYWRIWGEKKKGREVYKVHFHQ